MRLLMILSGLSILLIGCSETPKSPLIEGTPALSGIVIDTHGDRVADLSLLVQYIQIDPDGVETTSGYLQSNTKTTGHFSFSNIPLGQIQFRLVPEFTPQELTPYRLISVQIGEVLYYPNDLSSPYSTDYVAAFSITADTHLADIQLRVKEKMRIRVKVTFKNGMPLANYPLYLNTDFNGFKSGGYSFNTQIHTDIHGYFTRYVARAGDYRITVKYQGLLAESNRFLLNDGEHREDLILIFDSQPIPRSITPLESKADVDG